MNFRPKKEFTAKEVLQKLERYCALEDRCEFQIKEKLRNYELSESEKSDLLASLISDKFVDNARYASSFVRGKFRMKGWGKQKLQHHLFLKFIDQDDITNAIEEIPAKAYLATLHKTIDRKFAKLKQESDFKKKQALIAYCVQRGFEPSLVFETVDKLKLFKDSAE